MNISRLDIIATPNKTNNLVPTTPTCNNFLILPLYFLSNILFVISELNLSHNQISNLPDELSDMNDLQRLDISHNHFMSLPSVVFIVPNLTHLNAEKNFITCNLY